MQTGWRLAQSIQIEISDGLKNQVSVTGYEFK